MPLPINIETLLNKQKIESNRIEFKKGWNPASVYHSICAFANDIDDLGGGYILVGVEEDRDTGMAMRPVCGVPIEKIEKIHREMVGFNNKIDPFYLPRTSIEEIDGKQVLVIWCPSGISRPYSVPEDVAAKTNEYIYVRSGTSSIQAREDVLDELRNMSNRVPFDELGNPDIKMDDLSSLLLREYLVKVGSKLADDLQTRPLKDVLEQLDLFTGPSENRVLRNVSAMMFCENPSKFFKRTQVEIVFFPEGRLRNPNNLYEGPVITGSVTQIIERTLEYLKRMIVVQKVVKPNDDHHSIKCFSYPYQAIEESVTNSLYHRDYREWEPVVITVEPGCLTIQNVGGPDRSISSADILKCDLFLPKRYRNRRLGEYLKELDLTEGRSTGIPTIQKELEMNGSARAVVETDDDRSFFRIVIPCHDDFDNVIANVARRDSGNDKLSKGLEPRIIPKYNLRSSWDIGIKVIHMIEANPGVTISQMSDVIGISRRAMLKVTNKLQDEDVIRHVGPSHGGHWEIVYDRPMS